MVKHRTSTGEYISDATIKKRLSENYRHHPAWSVCEACGCKPATEHSHVISKQRCKELGKADLIYSRENWFFSCRKCHHDWEAVNGDQWTRFKNLERLIPVLQKHDPQGYMKRVIQLKGQTLDAF